MLSLWDYLGYPAGEKLEKLVADYAKIRKYTELQYRAIQTRSYSGYVTTYSKEFLDEFFAVMNLTNTYVINSLKEAEGKMQQKLEELNTLLSNDFDIQIDIMNQLVDDLPF